MADYTADDELCERRHDEAKTVLRAHWRNERWRPFSPEEFYPTWSGIARYAWALLRCNLLDHQWWDSHYDLYGTPSDNRQCERCGRSQILRTP